MQEFTKFVVAYGLMIVLANFCHFLGTLPVDFVVASCLAKVSKQARGIVGGAFSGLGGVAASVAFAYFVFRRIFDSSPLSLFALLAATAPLLISIRNDFAESQLFFSEITEARDALRNQPGARPDGDLFMALGVRFRAVGTILGIVLAFVGYFMHAAL